MFSFPYSLSKDILCGLENSKKCQPKRNYNNVYFLSYSSMVGAKSNNKRVKGKSYQRKFDLLYHLGLDTQIQKENFLSVLPQFIRFVT